MMRHSLSVSNDAELLGGLGSGDFNGANSDVGAGVAMLLKHAAVVHLVDMIAGEDEYEFGALAADGVDVLVDGVRRCPDTTAAKRASGAEGLRCSRRGRRAATSRRDVAVQAEGFVLREYENAAEIRIDALESVMSMMR